MSKEAIIIQSFNDVKQQYEYSVKGYDVTESVKILLKRHKEEYDKEKKIFAGIDGYLEAQKEYQSQITDLEAKLAESEKQIKDAREAGNMAVDSWCKNRRKYEAQIAEIQNKSFILYSMLYETLEKQGCDNVASQIDQMTGWTYDKEADWLKGNRNYDQLKQQLAEKEKEIERLNLEFETQEDWQEKWQKLYDETCNLTQDKISFAVEQLEKVKEHNDNLICDDEDYYNYITAFINNQIKAIKEEK